MASLPQKGTVGENFKAWVVPAVNQLIDYLNAMRVRKGPGIEVNETPSGVIVSLAKPQTQTPQVASTGGGGTTYGIEATIDGSTASVALVSGSTAGPVSVVPEEYITISGGTNNTLFIGTTTSGENGNLVKSQVYMSTGVFMLAPDTVNYYYCPQAYNSDGSAYDAYNFNTEEDREIAIEAIEEVLGSTISDTTNYSDDSGNTIFILPQNPAPLARVVVNTAPCSGRAVVVTPDARRIVDAYGDPQGVENGLCTDQLKKGFSILYLFVNSISGWPTRVYDDVHSDVEVNKATIVSCIQNDGGCWVKIDLKLQPVS